MSDWTAGYVADVGYTFGYYNELNPLRLRLAFLNTGLAFPEVSTACELGFGQGMSANIHAAASASQSQWYGTDFNSSQAGFAQELAAASGAGAQLFDQAFAEFCNRPDLPDFDYIGLHGLWSWISDENRAVIVEFIRRKLKVGGVLYISYNTQPGWAAMAPMRDLLAGYSEVMGAPGQGIVARIDASLAFAEKLLATNPRYARANPNVSERIKKIKEQNRNYLAHEYFNRDWLPMSFARMAEWLAPAKVSYACSAHYLDQIDGINLSAEQQALLKELPDPLFCETVRDFCVNQQFRRDYWVKGPRRLSMLEQGEAARAQRVALVQPRADVVLKVKSSLGEVQMQDAVYNPILNALANHQAKTVGQIEQAVQAKGIRFPQLMQAVMVLNINGAVLAVQDEAQTQKAKKHTDKLNAFLMNKARSSGDISYLASPVSGGGIATGRFQQLFLLAKSQGKKQPAEWTQFVWQLLNLQGQRILKAGKKLETVEENLAELTAQANTFAEKQLPILKVLGIA
jgi:SAM-dependent methyltransferase